MELTKVDRLGDNTQDFISFLMQNLKSGKYNYFRIKCIKGLVELAKADKLGDSTQDFISFLMQYLKLKKDSNFKFYCIQGLAKLAKIKGLFNRKQILFLLRENQYPEIQLPLILSRISNA